MRKLLTGLGILLSLSVGTVMAAPLPDNIQTFVKASFPDTNFRFDGVVILPDNTVYLPLIPSKFNDDGQVKIKSTIPAGLTMSEKPDAVILSNDYVLLKMLTNSKGKNTVVNLTVPPLELRTGLLPQDMLVPKNFIVPANLKNIIGNLSITTTHDTGLVIPVAQSKESAVVNSIKDIVPLQNKMLYITSNVSKNIQVVNPAKKTADYAFYQESTPITIKGYQDFLLVTSYDKKSMDVISLADEKVIKEISFKTQPDEIVIDEKNKTAYVSSGDDASIYVVDLNTMTIKKQLKLNGMCEKVILSDDGTKLFYNDKQTREIWAVELDNDYLLKEIGRFPNVSKIAYLNGKIYVTSRTKSRLAIIDYDTMGLMSENEITAKPVDMLTYKNDLFVLGAENKTIDVIDTAMDMKTQTIELTSNQFPTKMTRIGNSNLVLVTDAKAGSYSILDLDKKAVIKTNQLDTPVNSIVIMNQIKKIGK